METCGWEGFGQSSQVHTSTSPIVNRNARGVGVGMSKSYSTNLNKKGLRTFHRSSRAVGPLDACHLQNTRRSTKDKGNQSQATPHYCWKTTGLHHNLVWCSARSDSCRHSRRATTSYETTDLQQQRASPHHLSHNSDRTRGQCRVGALGKEG